MRLFRRMWIWTQCDEDHQRQQRRTNNNKDLDQSGAWQRLHVSSSGIVTTTTTGRFRNIDRIKVTPRSMSWRKMLLPPLLVLLVSFIINVFCNHVVEGYTVATDRRWMRVTSSCMRTLSHVTTTTTASRFVMRNQKATLEFQRRSFRLQNIRRMLLLVKDYDDDDDDDDEYADDDEIVSRASNDEDDDGAAAENEDNTVLGEISDTGGVVLHDLLWRVEKLRLEEQNIQRFLKARPRFLPYNECRKWVQALHRWQTEDDWNEWIAMGEKRNAYIPVRSNYFITLFSYFILA